MSPYDLPDLDVDREEDDFSFDDEPCGTCGRESCAGYCDDSDDNNAGHLSRA